MRNLTSLTSAQTVSFIYESLRNLHEHGRASGQWQRISCVKLWLFVIFVHGCSWLIFCQQFPNSGPILFLQYGNKYLIDHLLQNRFRRNSKPKPPSMSNQKSLYVEIVLVADTSVFEKYGRDKTVVTQRLVDIANVVSAVRCRISIHRMFRLVESDVSLFFSSFGR